MSTLIDVGQWSALEGVEGRQSAKEAEGARSQRGVSNEVSWAGGDTGEVGEKERGGGKTTTGRKVTVPVCEMVYCTTF